MMTARNIHNGTVAVLGNGPVGQTTALLLARWGIRVIVLDGRPERDPIGSKAICQQRDVLEVWAAVGVGEQVAAEGVTWDTASTFYRNEKLFTQPFVDNGRSAFPPFVNISQARTEELLDERIAAEPLIEVRWGHHVDGIDQDEAGVRVLCTTADGPAVVPVDYAVATMGARADAFRRHLGLDFAGRTFDDKFLICDIKTDIPDWAHERRFYFDPEWNPGRQVLIHPCPDSTFRIDWQVPGDYDLDAEAASGALDRRIRQIIGNDLDYEIVWKSVYRFHARLVDRMRVGRVLVAGDCAHLVSPFGARGLNSGVGDAENAAWKLAFVLRGWADESLLDTYDTERRAAALENIEVTSATMDFLVPQTDELRARRVRILGAAAGDPDARAQVDSGRLAEPFWYVDSPLTTPDPTRPFTGRPAKGVAPQPVPGVLLPDMPVRAGRAVRLRALAREGFLLLHGSAVDPESVRTLALGATRAPVRIHGIDDLDPSAALAESLSAAPHEVWVIRPDAHIAAVVDGTDPEALVAAVQAAAGRTATPLAAVG
ncbi:FAD-dependent monooxygenase [Rhodococcus sp. CSLK01-03]|uniref:FAD-dependent monooxygenase n=2 Tax=Nocardiaceae TaxID=85025 RepID=A0ABT7RH88_9NOCA|nr:FAD-dependent monooxygenase [Rhodococcus indonesiensis]MDM7487005.1 FAD-dependent monooxygenase [Rhodococcus indonesiensis]